MFASVDGTSTQDESIAAHFARRSFDRQQQVTDAANQFLDAWAVSELFFDDAALKLIESVWNEKAQLAGDVARWSSEVDTLGAESRGSHAKLFGEETATRIDVLERTVKESLRRLAVAE